jgi:hypothetical protein
MYTLYLDKPDQFSCKVDIDGADLDDSQVRLVVEGQRHNLLFYGELSEDGSCTIPLAKLKGLLKEGAKGSMKLEVIAEDTFFTPWEGEYQAKASKKVVVEVAQQAPAKPKQKVVVEVNQPKPQNKPNKVSNVNTKTLNFHTKALLETLRATGVNSTNYKANIGTIGALVKFYITEYKPNQSPKTLIQEVVKGLK